MPEPLEEQDINQNNLNNEYSPQWDRPMRLVATVFLIIATIYTLTLLTPVFLMLALSFVFGFGISKICLRINRNTPLNWAATVTIVYISVVIILTFLLLSLIPNIVREVNNLITNVENAYEQLQESARDFDEEDGIISIFGIDVDANFVLEPLMAFVAGDTTTAEGTTDETHDTEQNTVTGRQPIDPTAFDLQSVFASVMNVAGQVTGVFTSVLGSVAGFISNMLLALFVSFLVLIDLPNSRRILANTIPPSYHREYAIIFNRLNHVWNGFFKGQVLIGIIIGLLTYIQLTIFGVAGAIVLALVVGFISLIPTVGGFIALIPLSIVPLLTGSTTFPEMSNITLTLLTIIINLVISQIIWNSIAPIILGDALDLPLPVIVVGVFVGAAIGGILGAFLIAPVVSSLRIIVMYIVAKIGQRDPFPSEARDLTMFTDAL